MTNLTVNQKYTNPPQKLNPNSVEIVSLWKNTVLQVVHLNKNNPKKLKDFYIGEDFTANFHIPADIIGGYSKIPLVINKNSDLTFIVLNKGMSGDITYSDGRTISLTDFLNSDKVKSFPEIEGCYSTLLPDNAKFHIIVGEWTFLVNSVTNSELILSPMAFDWNSQVFTGVSVAIHALFILLVSLTPSTPGDMSFDQQVKNNRYVKYFLTAATVEQKKMPLLKSTGKTNENSGKGKSHAGSEGKMGTINSNKTNGKFAIKGLKNNRNPHMKRDEQKEIAKNSGVLQFISSNILISPFGKETSSGNDPENAIGGVYGDYSGDSFGYGALGIQGTGRGGGGTGVGTIGSGTLHTIGHGGGSNDGNGSYYGKAGGDLNKREIKKAIVTGRGATVQGSLSKGVIRRVIHQHINEIKYCYESGLSSRPDLEGRIGVKFIISRNGSVQGAVVASSTLGNSQVENCIAKAVRRWTFPQPSGGGVVIVLYPFQLTAPE